MAKRTSGPKIALIVNPIAGVGGPLALKGSDGGLAEEALAAGAELCASARAATALKALRRLRPQPRLLTCAGAMGEQAALDAGLTVEIGYSPAAVQTTRADTAAAARSFAASDLDLLLFAGGDGTALDILEAIGDRVPVLGIPAGVKMHSAVFATSPRTGGELAAAYLTGTRGPDALVRSEVLDRLADGAPKFFGALVTPYDRRRLQRAKAIGEPGDTMLTAACASIADEIAADGQLTLIGPGTTMLEIKRRLGIDGTLLGVDAVRGRQLVKADADRATLLDLAADEPVRLLLGVVGGQGFLLGRGNQQIGPELLHRIGRDKIIVVASIDKLAALPEARLLVDSGDGSTNAMLSGFLQVRYGVGRSALVRVAAG